MREEKMSANQEKSLQKSNTTIYGNLIRNLCGLAILIMLPFLYGISGCNGGGTGTETLSILSRPGAILTKTIHILCIRM